MYITYYTTLSAINIYGRDTVILLKTIRNYSI